jgi:hypothetical protein
MKRVKEVITRSDVRFIILIVGMVASVAWWGSRYSSQVDANTADLDEFRLRERQNKDVFVQSISSIEKKLVILETNQRHIMTHLGIIIPDYE